MAWKRASASLKWPMLYSAVASRAWARTVSASSARTACAVPRTREIARATRSTTAPFRIFDIPTRANLLSRTEDGLTIRRASRRLPGKFQRPDVLVGMRQVRQRRREEILRGHTVESRPELVHSGPDQRQRLCLVTLPGHPVLLAELVPI